MPIPYRKVPTSTSNKYAAYLEIVWLPSARAFYGGLLVIDGLGQPLEFVYNTLPAPAGFLWPEEQVSSVGISSLSRSLFEACRCEPELLVCRESLGSPEYCKTEIAVSIPFAQVVEVGAGLIAEWSWINDPPTTGMSAYGLAETLRSRGFGVEPFNRILLGLQEVYPEAPWQEAQVDSHEPTA